jgi:fructosamine-3-kinase
MTALRTTELNEFLYRNGLAKRSDIVKSTPLAGGVSSDIWRVELPDKVICVKRALARLKVKADWFAPIERNNYEWEWFRFVHDNFSGIVPNPLAHDSEMGMLAMEFLPPEDYTNWKSDLLSGTADAEFSFKVGQTLGNIHAKSAGDERIKRIFATDDLFFALRIEPYLLATAKKHPDLAPEIVKIADDTLAAKIALVHGDVSPKNILKGKQGPVFLDAETAWYGDPAFDLAFCLNHFLLKAIFLPEKMAAFLTCFNVFVDGYLEEVNWEPKLGLDGRAARLLPILFLARIDGKSPVEYLTHDRMKAAIRHITRRLMLDSPSLRTISDKFRAARSGNE